MTEKDGGKLFIFFFFNDTATTEIYTLSLHDALPIYKAVIRGRCISSAIGINPERDSCFSINIYS